MARPIQPKATGDAQEAFREYRRKQIERRHHDPRVRLGMVPLEQILARPVRIIRRTCQAKLKPFLPERGHESDGYEIREDGSLILVLGEWSPDYKTWRPCEIEERDE